MYYSDDYIRPFFYEGNDEGCLIIHGFTGSPAQMRLLGEHLHVFGYTVSGILLKGHGTNVQDMEKATWEDWIRDVETGYNRLCQHCRKVNIIGVSMGGILSLIMAERYPINKIVTIAAPIHVFNRLLPYAFVLKYFKRYVQWEKPKPQEGEALEYNIGYTSLPVKGAASLFRLMKMAQKNLKDVYCPVLIIQSTADRLVKPESAKIIFDGISSSQKKILWLERSKHLCILGPERDRIHREIVSFLKDK